VYQRMTALRHWLPAALLAVAMSSGVAQTTTASASANAPAAEANEAGVIDLIEGQVNVLDTNRKRRTVKVGDKLFEGDSVVTGKNGELHAELTDGGVLAIRPDTAMRIIKYQANGDNNDTSIFGLLKGSFRSITGWIGKNAPASYQVRTPTATVGVRGTDHEPLVIPAGSSTGEPGTYDRVNIGTSTITGSNGAVDVTPGRAGFFAQHGRDRPRVLDQVPTYFRPTRNENRLQGRHERVHAVTEQRRTQRQQVMQERARQRQERGQTKAEERKSGQREQRQEKQRERAEQRRQAEEQRKKATEARTAQHAGQREKAEEARAHQADERRKKAEQQRGEQAEARRKKAEDQRKAGSSQREEKRHDDKKREDHERERRGNR
jgi:hypothetical protein